MKLCSEMEIFKGPLTDLKSVATAFSSKVLIEANWSFQFSYTNYNYYMLLQLSKFDVCKIYVFV